ncbi:ABC transporter permease [Anaerocolumna sp. AGMB13025]|uniref:ABC transporter permease n=1 Tax=Anaerocolumna sp. AGMB13025 TaxID=3039116 RepID=UPI00241C41B6|nr:ABC transporter permease [Anaerocolumna sp. AGMB13025]WFR57634.1 ABC transporter permease [Anaerocolumna sp. AGMB13025]
MNEMTLKKPVPKLLREINVVITILARDINLCFKSPGMLIMSLAMPIVMMGMLGGSLSQNMAGGLGFNYNQYLLIGMLVNMLFMTTASGISSLVEDHVTDFTQEMMISPISRYSIVIGKILGSSFGAIVGMLGTIVTGFFMGISLTLGQYLLILLMAPFMCLSAGALAMIVIGLIKSNKMANMAVMLITMPQMFLSGAIIPINNSKGILYVLSRIMPMTYCLDLTRAVVYSGTKEYDSVVLFNPLVSLIVIAVLTVVFLVIGTYFFARSEKNR